MKQILVVLLTLVGSICFSANLVAQEGGAEVSIHSDRVDFRADGDQQRNFVELVSKAQLQTIRLMTTDLRFTSNFYIDSVQNAPRLDLSVNVPSLTTGYQDLDTRILSKDYINFGDAQTLEFTLLGINEGRIYKMENEKRIEVNGRGELKMGDQVDTVSIILGLRYLQGNKITATRMPGDVLHIDGTIPFRLSSFGIEVPKENRLMVNDQVQLQFDIYASSEYQLPADTSMSGESTNDNMAGSESGGGR